MKISIVTPSFNQCQFIRRTLDSVLARQNYDNVEHLIFDGLSTDGTVDVLKEYQHQYPEKMKYISEKDVGQSNAINKGFHQAQGDIIGWINSDDYFEDNIFKFVVQFFLDHPEVDMIYGVCHIVDANDNFVIDFEDDYGFKKCRIDYKEFNYKNLMDVYSGLIPQQTVFFRKRIFNSVGYLDESFHFVMDYEYWLRIGRAFKIQRVEKHLANFRTHRDAKTTFRNIFTIFSEALRARRKNGGCLISRFHLYVAWVWAKALIKMLLVELRLMRADGGTINAAKR